MTWLLSSVRSTVSGFPPAFWWLWAGTLVSRAGAFVLPFLAFYVTRELGRSAAFAGAVLAAYGFGSMGAALVGGVLTDRVGRRPVLLGSQLSSAVALVGLGLSQGTVALIAWAALFGLTSNASRPAYSAMMADIVRPEDRMRAFSLNYWAINLGFAVAPVLAGLLSRYGYLTLFLVDAVTTAVFALLVFLRVPESRPEPSRSADGPAGQGSLATVLRDGVFVSYVVLTLGFALIFMQHLSTLPVQMGADGLSPATYGSVLAINGALIVLVTVPLAAYLERFERSHVMAVSSLLVGGGFALTAAVDTVAGYALTVVLWTIGEVLGAGVGVAIVADLAPAALRGRYNGVFSLSFAVASFVAPLAGGAIYDRLGSTALWLACGALSVVLAVGHLAIAPARGRRMVELQAVEGSTGEPARPSEAVPTPAPREPLEAEHAVTREQPDPTF